MKLNAITLTLLLSSTAAIAEPNLTISTTTNSRDFPLSAEQPLVVPLVKDSYQLKITGLEGDCQAPDAQVIKFNQPIALNCGKVTELPLKIRFTGDYSFELDPNANTLTFKREPKKVAKTEFKRPLPQVTCEVYQGGEVTIELGDSFKDGTSLRDAYSGQVVSVKKGKVSLTPSAQSGGLVLLEPVKLNKKARPFDYRNANIYFVMVDRFNNGDTSNDQSYGRQKDGKEEIGTFHGGDLKGVIEKLDYIQRLGTDAIWLSPIVEQVHGFVGGGDSGSFPFYAYHGYWTRDFTKIDENFGRDEDLKTLVEEAHKRGIKVLLDAVINHSGYSTLADLQFDGMQVTTKEANLPEKWANWQPKSGENWHSYHSAIDYQSQNWSQWWGADWVRTGLPGYQKPGSSDITLSLAGLPDFRTESTQAVTPPQWLLENPGTRVVARDNYTVSDYLIEWQTDWVKRFGIDGYRVDTVKHVEGEVWQRLKQEATKSLDAWRKANGQSGAPFWMMGEVWGHSAYRSPYFDDGFDALINFDMQKKLDKGAACFSQMADTYRDYANTIAQQSDFNPVSYMSSHDTELFFSRFKDYAVQRNAANALLLSPGAVQIYYGDEVGRDIGPYADDFHQGTRSDMVWQLSAEQQTLLNHWQKLGQFRRAHPAVGAGVHQEIEQTGAYVFSRTLGDDKVVVAFVGHAAQ
ncbi:alpha-amylase [Vibrio vulnificus]|uniref:alpha-amylase n=1 Tax=Vibrio vulnificus TaxID=672 RepID=UPI001A1E3819|nr:alpha-amylase [Vibrio vulnificus]EHU5194709.1 alpha-amylase [Vibrio vulnificus]MCU8120886.1 alpha-amylase [Vibrio vulnificus]MCU8239359.1 alpha-amylase [Vibrio vulnificus]MCU8300640.1 alpha-amylase [Vibrio vulnificus]MDK2636117.1 alpha-amylase [Vibrio vulnificus]